ncbi:MAG: hypothetical protein K9M03_04670 [Kiritimatiellales bacterium]|nr:hypothetical protein [Kiritimatiellales bacterium]
MNRTLIRIGVYTPLILVLFCSIIDTGIMAVSEPNYVTDPSTCPDSDAQFPGQKCPAGLMICGVNGSDIPQCYDTSNIPEPVSTVTSTTQYTASLGGGYIIDCFAQPLDSAAPYCDNNGAWLCNRDSTCYNNPINKLTTCTGAGEFTCGACRNGYQTCNGDDSGCEVQTNVTNYPTGDNNNYGASCTAQCDTGYLDCDASGIDAGNGCEVRDNSECTTVQGVSGTYDGCTCVPDKSYFETGTESVYSAPDPLLWGTQVGTGLLLQLKNNQDMTFSVGNIGDVLTTGGLTASGTVATESGIVINMDNEAKDAVLVFGAFLGQQTLKFLNDEHVFEFSDDLRTTGNLSASGVLAIESNADVGGNLTVGGLINGIDISSLVSSQDDYHLKVSSGAGLTIDVAGGSYRLGGNVTNYNGVTGQSLVNDALNYVYFNTGGLVINQTGFPTDQMYIQLSTVLTAGGDISTVTDRRIFNSSDTEHTVTKVFKPEFEGAAYAGDGSNNVGQLRINNSGGNLMNYYMWTSTRSSLNDYDILLRFTLPPDFVRWGSTPLAVSYKSSSSSASDNQMDITLYDSSGNIVTLSGTSTGLSNTGWTTTTHTYDGIPTWTAGEEALIRFRMYAKDNEEMHLGTVKFTYIELQSE